MAHRSRNAFTIIELLVAMSIITVLFSIGVPAIVKASNIAAETKCLSNLRSIGQSTATYLTDYKQVYPRNTGVNGELRLIGLVGKPGVFGWFMAQQPSEDRPLFDYLNGQTGIAECPLDRGSAAVPATSSANNFEYLGTSYVYPDRFDFNLFQARYDIWSIEGHRLTDVQQPSKKLVVADMSLFVEPGLERNQWHQSISGAQSGSVAFVDGHVAVTAAKVDAPAYTNPISYLTQGYITTNSAQIETWARHDDYY